ncbi:hypothetical protein [Nonomuraea dietziae]|uniref:hypothetical protein n=1 Tax=Nonomuraea dietziae TaxID=65515 RepID=UPI0031DEE922
MSDALKAAFHRDRGTLGKDMYGAELAKKMPEIEERIFSALSDYIDQLEGVATNLHANAGTYELVDRPITDGS